MRRGLLLERAGVFSMVTLANKLTVEELESLFLYKPETGELYWHNTRVRRVKAGDLAGIIDKGRNTYYRRVRIKGQTCRAHVIAWALSNRAWPKQDIDHKNGDGLDNRISNLREVSQSQNHMNMRSRKEGSSKFKWVS
jgi:hypothetical protein